MRQVLSELETVDSLGEESSFYQNTAAREFKIYKSMHNNNEKPYETDAFPLLFPNGIGTYEDVFAKCGKIRFKDYRSNSLNVIEHQSWILWSKTTEKQIKERLVLELTHGLMKIKKKKNQTGTLSKPPPSLPKPINSDNTLNRFPTPDPILLNSSLAAAQDNVMKIKTIPIKDINQLDSYGNTVLIWAANNGSIHTVNYLISIPTCDLNIQGYLGNTAISRCARGGHVECMAALLKAKANPNIGNVKKQYPLHFAAYAEQIECIQVMISSKLCDYTVLDRKGRIPAEDTRNRRIKQMLINAAKEIQDQNETNPKESKTSHGHSHNGQPCGGHGHASKKSATASPPSSCYSSNIVFVLILSLLCAVYFNASFQFTALHDWETIIASTAKTSTEIERKQKMERAWNMVSTFENYPQWNTFTTFVGTKKPVKINDPVTLHVTLDPPFPVNMLYLGTSNLTLDFVWLEYEPKEYKMCWGIRGNVISNMFLTSYRCCELKWVEKGVQVRHSDLNVGLMAPIVRVMYMDVIEQGFKKMTKDMKLFLGEEERR